MNVSVPDKAAGHIDPFGKAALWPNFAPESHVRVVQIGAQIVLIRLTKVARVDRDGRVEWRRRASDGGREQLGRLMMMHICALIASAASAAAAAAARRVAKVLLIDGVLEAVATRVIHPSDKLRIPLALVLALDLALAEALTHDLGVVEEHLAIVVHGEHVLEHVVAFARPEALGRRRLGQLAILGRELDARLGSLVALKKNQ